MDSIKKKYFITLSMFLLGFISISNAAVEDDGSTFPVTFQVDMNEYSGTFTIINVSGPFNEWCASCAPMSDDDSDGIWELVIELDAGTHEYKYQVDEWTDQESLIPGSECTLTSGEFTNRIIEVTSDAVLPVVCWESCLDCENNINSYDVTFQVDMSEYEEAYTIVNINGEFNGWCGGCSPMTDDDGDDIYEITITLQEGSAEYKFSLDGWTAQEALTSGDPCTLTTDEFTNRILDVTQNETLAAVCWNSCSTCGDEVITHDVTFKVDLSEYEEAFTTVNVNGIFNGWCGDCAVMTDDNGDDIYEITITLPEGETEYKFTLDGWTVEESLTEGSSCTLTTDGFTNRFLNVTSFEVLDAVCWEICEACIVSVDENDISNSLSIYPNPSNGILQVQFENANHTNNTIEIYSAAGALVHSERMNSNQIQIDLTHLSRGLYQVQVLGEGYSIKKSVLLFN